MYFACALKLEDVYRAKMHSPFFLFSCNSPLFESDDYFRYHRATEKGSQGVLLILPFRLGTAGLPVVNLPGMALAKPHSVPSGEIWWAYETGVPPASAYCDMANSATVGNRDGFGDLLCANILQM